MDKEASLISDVTLTPDLSVDDNKTVRLRVIPHQAQYLREILSDAGDLSAVNGYVMNYQTHRLEDFETGTVFEFTGTKHRSEGDPRMMFQFTTYVKGDGVKYIAFQKSGQERIDSCMSLPPHYADFINDHGLPCIGVKGNAGSKHMLFVNDSIVPCAHLDGDGLYTCRPCGRKYDGFAQCTCTHC